MAAGLALKIPIFCCGQMGRVMGRWVQSQAIGPAAEKGTNDMQETILYSTTARLTKAVGDKIHKIAADHGASFVGPIREPGNRITGWLTGPNRGEPFDRMLRNKVIQAVRDAGITALD